MVKKTMIATGVGIVLCLPVSANADTILFDFNQDGNYTETDNLDWAPGNALAVNSVPLAPNATFTTYIQAELTRVTNAGGGDFAQPIGTSGPYEITYEIELLEEVAFATDIDFDNIPDVVGFNHLGGTVNVYWDDFSGGTVNADPITGNAGTGYDDGTLILSAAIVPTVLGADFSLTGGSANNDIVDLDQFGGDDLGGVQTVTGSGDATIDAEITFIDDDFFLGIDDETIISFLLNSTLEDPFDGANPELLVGGFAPVYGDNSINGIWAGDEVESFHFEADANSSFETAIPEPSTIALIGVGLALIGGIGRRRKT